MLTVNLDDILMVAGAPTATGTASQPGSSNPGGVFYCPITTSTSDCRRVSMDAGGKWIIVRIIVLIMTCAVV